MKIFIKEKTNLFSSLFDGSGQTVLRPGQVIEVEQDRVDLGQVSFLSTSRHGPRSTGRVLRVLELVRLVEFEESDTDDSKSSSS